METKMQHCWTTPAANRGYSAPGREKLKEIGDVKDFDKIRENNPDLKESLEIGREGEEGHPNHWPEETGELAGFKATMLKFHDQCKQLHTEVMRAIAIGMELDEHYFDRFTDMGDNTLRLLHYPEVRKDVFTINPGQMRAAAHSDYGSLTLLFQDMRGGLQVRSPNGTFVDATPIEDTVVVNAGDLLARWSNDTIKSTVHQVVEPPSSGEGDVYPARYSIA
jgi:isopenicillin N synthase-like dioxygenase